MKVPASILRRLYTRASLQNVPGGVRFQIKNRLSEVRLTGVGEVTLDGRPVDPGAITLQLRGGRMTKPAEVTREQPIAFPLRETVHLLLDVAHLDPGAHRLALAFDSEPFGGLRFEVEDAVDQSRGDDPHLPRDDEDDYSPAAIDARRRFVESFSGTTAEHLWRPSFDPHVVAGNCESFTGVAQVPIGFAGPLRVLGEHAEGEFLIPLATTEGTLVASYNRGMKLLNLSGGVRCTVMADAMQRAPVFVFESARDTRDFVAWCVTQLDPIREAAERTSSVAKLEYVDYFTANKFAFLRFNFSTGDAAGQNMVGRATFAACNWIVDHYEPRDAIKNFFLESNFATDKKASNINLIRTRGKRVVAEATIPRSVLIDHLRVAPEQLVFHSQVANIGAILSGANNNGLHSANAITAMFIATGQDVANVAESSAGVIFAELTTERDLYLSMTIPSLIVATHGGGTALPTQRECLELLGCFGRGKVRKLAEIVAGVVLAGEISLAAAISASDWVSSHERYGRNR